MGTRRSDVLLHPVRFRIVLAIAGEELTTAELAQRMPDVAAATLYRQVAILVGAGLLEVVGERRVRGGTERTYRLVTGAAHVGSEEAAAMTRDEHYEGFLTFVGALVEAFGRYLDHPESDPSRDGVGYRQAALWLSDDELQRLADELNLVLEPHLANRPSPARTRRTLSTILIPDTHARPGRLPTKDSRDATDG